jgi:hypothetical protein
MSSPAHGSRWHRRSYKGTREFQAVAFFGQAYLGRVDVGKEARESGEALGARDAEDHNGRG